MSTTELLSHHRVRLLDLEPTLDIAIPYDDRSAARRLLTAEARPLAPGPWAPDLLCANGRQGHLLLVSDGLLLREVTLGGRRAAQVYGPGDVLRPAPALESSLGEQVEWTVLAAGMVAVLDDLFIAAARKWPLLRAVTDDRLFAQIERGAVQLAISHQPRIEQRLLGMFWHLADQYGQVTRDGVVMPYQLTHETIGRLVGARRPTVTLGLTALQDAGNLRRRPGGGWLLDVDSQSLVAEPVTDAHPVTERSALRAVAG